MRTAQSASEWYALNPRVRRLWVFQADEVEADTAYALDVVVVLAPVGDSDEVGPIWLAKGREWQSQLQRLLGRGVRLDCIDEDETAPRAGGAQRPRVCVTSIAWREVSANDIL